MRYSLKPEAWDNLKRACAKRAGLASEIEILMAENLDSEAAWERCEQALAGKRLPQYLRGIPRTGSPRWKAVSTALFRAIDAADSAEPAENCLAVLLAPDFRKPLSLISRQRADRPLDVPQLVHRLGLALEAARASEAAGLAFMAGVAAASGYAGLRRDYAERELGPSLDRLEGWLVRLAVRRPNPGLLGAALDFLAGELFFWFAVLGANLVSGWGGFIEPILRAWAEAPDDASRARLDHSLKAIRRLALGCKEKPDDHHEKRRALVADATSFVLGLEPERLEQFRNASGFFGHDSWEFCPWLYRRMAELPTAWQSHLDFLAHPRLHGFVRAWMAMYSAGRSATLLGDILVALCEEVPLPQATPAYYTFCRNFMLADRPWNGFLGFWKTRVYLYAKTVESLDSAVLRAHALKLLLNEWLMVGAKAAPNGHLPALPRLTGLHRDFDALVACTQRAIICGSRDLEGVAVQAARLIRDTAWQRIAGLRTTTSPGLRRAVFDNAVNFGLLDELLVQIAHVPEEWLDTYLLKIYELVSGCAGIVGPDEIKAEFFRRLQADFWHRLYFDAALPWMMQVVYPVTGGIEILVDLDTKWAKTDGHRIFLPPYVSWFPDPAEVLPDNRNLTMYISLALHEAGHILGGSFAIDLTPLLEGLDDVKLFQEVRNAVEDYRIEWYLRDVAAHPQIDAVLRATNLYLYHDPGEGDTYNLMIGLCMRGWGYWDELVAANPAHQQVWDRLLAHPVRDCRWDTLGDFAVEMDRRFADLDHCNPAEGLELAMDIYRMLVVQDPERLALKRLIAELAGRLEQALRSRLPGTGGSGFNPGAPHAPGDTSRQDTPQPASDKVASMDELRELAERIANNLVDYYRRHSLTPGEKALDERDRRNADRIIREQNRRAMEAAASLAEALDEQLGGRAGDMASGSATETQIVEAGTSDAAKEDTAGPGEATGYGESGATAGDEPRAGANDGATGEGASPGPNPDADSDEANEADVASGPQENARAPDAPALAGQELNNFVPLDYTKPGSLRWFNPSRAEVKDNAERQRLLAASKRASPRVSMGSAFDLKGEKKLSRKPRGRIVRSRNPETGRRDILRTVQETDVTAVDKGLLSENQRFNHVSRRIGDLMRRLLKDDREDGIHFNQEDGDLDIDLLVETLANRRHHEVDFYEETTETRKSMSVLIGLDMSGSTGNVIRAAKNEASGFQPTVLDVEKHFALIFARAMAALTDDVRVFGFNSQRTTTVYRARPLEALSSFQPDDANRDGDFIRYCTSELKASPERHRYFVLLSDGCPNSVGYDGRDAMADTIAALAEARAAGLRSIYLNIDRRASRYLGEFAAVCSYARHFIHPLQLLKAAPDLVAQIVREVS